MEPFFAPESVAGNGFLLRSYEAGDGALLREATNSSFGHLWPWMPWAVRDQTAEEAEGLVRRFRARYLTGEDFTLGVFAPEGDLLLGGTGFHLREGPLESGCAEVGLWIRESHAREGLGTRVLVALTRWAFEAWPWERLTWRTATHNTASRRTAERAGYRAEGVLRRHLLDAEGQRRDTAVYAALRGEWSPPG